MDRLCIGHMRMKHSLLQTKEVQPKYQACKTVLSVEHILIECPKLAINWEKFYYTTTMQELL